jgi:hypothetical protein
LLEDTDPCISVKEYIKLGKYLNSYFELNRSQIKQNSYLKWQFACACVYLGDEKFIRHFSREN